MSTSSNSIVAALLGAATIEKGVLGHATAYHLSTEGQGWRANLTAACCRALGVSPDHGALLGAACELVHEASIVHDDVQDDNHIRRGEPTVSTQYGAAVAICVGDHLLVRAFAVLAQLPRAPTLVGLFADRVTEMAACQAEEFNPAIWQGMTQARYAALAAGKAGATVALAVESPAVVSGLTAAEVGAARRAARLIGTAYQAADDVEDLAPDLARGALNGVLALALEDPWAESHGGLLEVLTRARRRGLGRDEADARARRLSLHADQLLAWAADLLAQAIRDVEGHPLASVLIPAACGLRARLLIMSKDVEDAA